MNPAHASRCVSLTAALATLLLGAAGLPAQERTWLGWTAYWENDSFQPPGTGSDANYTNGVRVSAAHNPARNPRWVDRLGRRWRGTPLVRDSFSDINIVPVLSVVLGQNFFTPSLITDFAVDPRDRPYAGLLYGGVRLDLTEDPQDMGWAASLTLQHSAELDVGVLGPQAFGEEIQTGVHVLRGSRIPKGWDHQIGFDPLFQAGYMARGRLGGSHLDVTPHVGAMVGNPQTAAYGGATARVGINLTGFPALLIPMAVEDRGPERPDFELALLAGVEGRAFAHNAVLDGGLIGSDTLAVDRESLVGDLRLGASVRLTDWRVTYTWARRTSELSEGPFSDGEHDYGSLALSYEPFGRTPAARAGTFLGRLMDGILGTVFEDFLFEAVLGPGRSDVPGAGARDGTGMHVAAAKGMLGNRAFLGIEMAGIGREGPRTAAGENHTDEFLRSFLFTVRARPLGVTTGPGILHVRAGVGSGEHRTQVVAPLDGRVIACPPGTVRDDGDGDRCHASDAGTALLLGGGYAISVGPRVSVGLDLSWNRVALDAGAETFFVPALSMRFHPGG